MGKSKQELVRNLTPCIKEKRNPQRRWGLLFERAILQGKRTCFPHSEGGKNQNFTVLCVAETGGGKSTLGIHANLIAEGEMSLDRYAFDIQSTAESYDLAKDLSEDGFHGVFWDIDELKLYSRRSNSAFNVDMLDLFFSVRGFNIFTWANVVSLSAIDKLLVEEQSFDAIVYIYASQARFYWLDYKGFMKMFRKHGNYKHSTFQEFGEYYAAFDSYFGPAPGSLYDEYEDRKRAGMRKTSEEFVDKYSDGERLSLNKACKVVGVTPPTMKKYLSMALEDGTLSENPRTPTGWAFTEEQAQIMRDYISLKSPQGGSS